MEEKKTPSVQVIDRTFHALEFVAKNGPSQLKDIYTALGINKASILRIVTSLCYNGYLTHDPANGTYSLSFKAFEVGVNAIRNISYINIIKGVLEELSTELGAIAQFSVEDHNELLCLECFNRNDMNFSIFTNVGQRTPLYATSAGKAILSTYSGADISRKWADMKIIKLTPYTITSLEDFMQEITLIRQRGYATDMQESELSVFCIGSVLLDYNRHPVGSISLSSNSMDKEREDAWSRTLLERTHRLSQMLGFISH